MSKLFGETYVVNEVFYDFMQKKLGLEVESENSLAVLLI